MKTLTLTSTQPDEDVVEFLEDLVKIAKAGDMVGVTVAYCGPGGAVTTSWHAGDGAHASMMLGATQLLSYRVAKQIDD